MNARLQASGKCEETALGLGVASIEIKKSSLRKAVWIHLRGGIQLLNSAYFAMVMATGIVAIASHLLGLERFGRILAWTNLAAYVILWVLTIVRLIKGFTVVFWATATGWIPMLFILGFWRSVYKKFKLAYDPLLGGAVSPLGMYTACTYRLAGVIHLSFCFGFRGVSFMSSWPPGY